jgi:hypothetical protein
MAGSLTLESHFRIKVLTLYRERKRVWVQFPHWWLSRGDFWFVVCLILIHAFIQHNTPWWSSRLEQKTHFEKIQKFTKIYTKKFVIYSNCYSPLFLFRRQLMFCACATLFYSLSFVKRTLDFSFDFNVH